MSTEAPEAEFVVRTSEPPRLRARARLLELAAHREILTNLVRKELKVKYSSSALGVAWSMLNPLLYLAVFYVVFTFILPNGVPSFPVYLLSGLIAWTLFSTATQQATASVVGNANLVTKVAFPREILPLASVGAGLVNFAFQLLVLLAFILVTAHPVWGWNLLLLPLALAVLLIFTTALALATSALNVRYRDMQHLVELALLAWFWVTPVVYPSGLVLDRLQANGVGGLFSLYLVNPLADVVLGFQRALYGIVTFKPTSGPVVRIMPADGIAWYAARLGGVAAASLVLLYLAWRLFFHRSGDFAEEL